MGAAAVWCSHPAAFSLARAEIVFLVSTRTERRRIIRLAFVLATGAASFLLLYFVSLTLYRCASLRKIAPSLISGASYFPPQGFAHTVGWLFDVFAASVRGGTRRGSGNGLFVVGVAALFRTNRGLGWMVCGSCIATLLATFAHRYPLGGRLLLFAAPIIPFVVAEGVGGGHSQGKLVHVVVARIVLFLPLLRDPRRPSQRFRNSARRYSSGD
jgi:hypothetical protein